MSRKPRQGQKLNREALLTYFNVRFTPKELARLPREVQVMGAELVRYSESEEKLIIKVPHFTKYAFGELESLEDENGLDDDTSEQLESQEKSKSSSVGYQQHSEGENIDDHFSKVDNQKVRRTNTGMLLEVFEGGRSKGLSEDDAMDYKAGEGLGVGLWGPRDQFGQEETEEERLEREFGWMTDTVQKAQQTALILEEFPEEDEDPRVTNLFGTTQDLSSFCQ